MSSSPPSSLGSPVERATFPLEARSPARARRFVHDVLRRWAWDGPRRDVELLTSELVTNAVLHARSSVDVSIRCSDRGVRVEVADRSAQVPVAQDYRVDAQTGRGLVLVERTSTSWGVQQREVGKTVWFEVAG